MRAQLWGVLWRSDNRTDGTTRRLMGGINEHGLPYLPLLFKTRSDAREYIKKKYGYIAERPDLRAEPHGWKMPLAVPVEVTSIVRQAVAA